MSVSSPQTLKIESGCCEMFATPALNLQKRKLQSGEAIQSAQGPFDGKNGYWGQGITVEDSSKWAFQTLTTMVEVKTEKGIKLANGMDNLLVFQE